ncbi:MAG: hypothetical protein LLG00_11265, partial [Planctomycetaceae bacterium]|nr:hypothetical protein [Planctomycetaceae bacterium]
MPTTFKSPASVFAAIALATLLGASRATADVIPEVSANRVIDLAAPDGQEKLPVVSGVALDPTGKLMAAVGDDHLVRILDAQSGAMVQRLKWHT